MHYLKDLSFRPRRGKTLQVLGICRISTIHQDKRSLDDQEALIRNHVNGLYTGLVDFDFIKTQGSGERLDRKEIREAEDKVGSERFDLVVVEDLGRIARRSWVTSFCERCEDFDVRVIAINDHLDTAQPDWRTNAAISVIRHETYNRDTAARIRRSHHNRFNHGGVINALPYGYLKPDGATKDDQLRKDPAAEPVYAEIFHRVEEGASFPEIAGYLNANGIPTGPCARLDVWRAGLVGLTVRNPLLKGLRIWNRRKSRRNNATGRHRAVKTERSEWLERWCPHLAFIEPERFDRIQRLLDERNAKCSRIRKGVDPRKNVSRKCTMFPGQHVVCGVCGRPCVFGGHGRMDRLMCSGVKLHLCWNSCTFNGKLGADAVIASVLAAVAEMPSFDDEVMMRLRQELDEQAKVRRKRREDIDRVIDSVTRKIANIAKAIAEGVSAEAVHQTLNDLEKERLRLLDERALMDQEPEIVPELPSVDELRALAKASLHNRDLNDPEFQRTMRSLLPEIHLVPFRLCTDNKVVPRLRVIIDFLALSPNHKRLRGEVATFRKTLLIDAFAPSQHVKHREQIMKLRAEGKTEREAAKIVGIAVQTACRAAQIQRTMDANGSNDPWIELTEAPEDVGKMRSHHHPLYRFEPLEGFPRAK